MKEVLIYWIIKPNMGKINMIKYLKNIESMNRVSCDFLVDQMEFWKNALALLMVGW